MLLFDHLGAYKGSKWVVWFNPTLCATDRIPVYVNRVGKLSKRTIGFLLGRELSLLPGKTSQ